MWGTDTGCRQRPPRDIHIDNMKCSRALDKSALDDSVKLGMGPKGSGDDQRLR